MIQKIKNFFHAQLTQGMTPHALALAFSIGSAFGVFPILGATTVLAAMAAYLLKLNQPVVQAANYTVGFLQLFLIPVFLRVGEWLTNSPPQALDPRVIMREFWADIPSFFARWGGAGLRAILAWSLIAPLAAILLYIVLRFFLSRVNLPVTVKPEERP